jgi:hypothetical protein
MTDTPKKRIQINVKLSLDSAGDAFQEDPAGNIRRCVSFANTLLGNLRFERGDGFKVLRERIVDHCGGAAGTITVSIEEYPE